MIAVAKIGGRQGIVKQGDIISVDKIDQDVGKKISLETLLVSEEDGSSFQAGTPYINGISVEAKIIAHGRKDKIRVFKMKPRKRYRRTLGHRQDFTTIEILKIQNSSETDTVKKISEKKETATASETIKKVSTEKISL